MNKSILSALCLTVLVAAAPGLVRAEDAAVPAAAAPAAQAPAAAANPAPTVTVTTPTAPAKPVNPAKAAVVPDATKTKVMKPKVTTPAAKPAAGDASEKLPWAADAKPVAGAKPVMDKAKAAAPKGAAADGPLKMACPGLYEAACREVPACSWIADVKLQTGADVKAHCVDRNPQAAKKDAGVKKPADKKAANATIKPVAPAVAPAGAQAPAVPKEAKEAVVKAAPAPAPAPAAAAPATSPAAPAAAPVP